MSDRVDSEHVDDLQALARDVLGQRCRSYVGAAVQLAAGYVDAMQRQARLEADLQDLARQTSALVRLLAASNDEHSKTLEALGRATQLLLVTKPPALVEPAGIICRGVNESGE